MEKPPLTVESQLTLMQDMFMTASGELAEMKRGGKKWRERMTACEAYLDIYIDLGGLAVENSDERTI